jgi:hypothetical protein
VRFRAPLHQLLGWTRRFSDSVALSRLTRKEEEESIQKLEEHIFVNLLPVKYASQNNLRLNRQA